jgi:hypothetical protein
LFIYLSNLSLDLFGRGLLNVCLACVLKSYHQQKNPRYPDFKHKQTGEALWVDGRNNPNWVISQLAVLDSRMSSLQDNERKPVSYMYADEFMTLDGNR